MAGCLFLVDLVQAVVVGGWGGRGLAVGLTETQDVLGFGAGAGSVGGE